MHSETIALETGHRRALVDLTPQVRRFLEGRGDGLVNIFVPHATAGLALIELGSGSESDLWDRIDDLLPRDGRYVHSHGSPGHGADHVLPAFVAPTLCLPVQDGRVALGTWQSIVLIDPNVDNSRRRVQLTFLSDGAS